MTSFDHPITRVTSSDLPFLAEFIHSAKLLLSINRLLYQPWPNEPLQRKQYTGAVEGAFADPSMECFKATHAESNEIIGYIVFAKKQASEGDKIAPQSQIPDAGHTAPEGMTPGILTEISGANMEINKAVEHIDRFELVYMCVEPRYQRQGLGSRLLHLGFNRAKAEGLPVTVGAEAPAHGFFDKLGFRETTHVDIDLREYAPPHSGFGIFRLTGMVCKP
ncbi:hypothetical protein N7452_002352 [Penicillium brevicompactum]|uniref:N-acetyltransferase domain-containing protein n=1 Tax=Penicillium brevicompactum TaxID=5074 RepID=A0A9W9UQ34_PENBR|nr:hypothetical protein N7452_002352 [Penicillium brevicompactum]